jgi:hypothetical protein
MNLKKFDNKCVQITDTDNKIYEGNCYFNDKEYNEHEYGRNEDSLQILNIIFYKSDIKKIKLIENLSSTDYGNLEELIIDSGLDFIEDAFDSEDKVHIERLIRCIKDNIEKFEDREAVERLIEKYNK